jgi:hypothetical protein
MEFNMNILELIKKENYIYLIYLKEHLENKIYKKELKNYIKYLKNNLINKNDLKLFIYDDLKFEEKEVLNNINIFPLLVIKEKNKEIEYITGIRNYNN